MKHIRLVFALSATLFVIDWASGYTLPNPPTKFTGPETVLLDSRGIPSVFDFDQGVTAMLGEVGHWNSGGLLLSGLPAVLTEIVSGDLINSVVFDPFQTLCIGSTCVARTFRRSTQQATNMCRDLRLSTTLEADTVFNLGHAFTSTTAGSCVFPQLYVEHIMRHEVGHMMGLSHSGPGNVMAEATSACENFVATADDLAGRDALYDCPCKSKGSSCITNSDCCSGSCKGKAGATQCK